MNHRIKGASQRLFALCRPGPALFGALLWLAPVAVSPVYAGTACAPLESRHAAHVDYIIDGDTIILDDGRHVRIVGLNAPEIGRDGKADQPYAEAARRRLAALLAGGHDEIQLAAAAERHDRYRRTLAYVYVEGNDVSRAMLAAGFAALIAIPPNIGRVRCYAAAERAAREAHRGIWSAGSGLVHAADDPAAERPGFEIVRGHITGVRVLRAGTRLDIGGGITVWIPAADARYFHVDPAQLMHRKVLVRGWLHRYRHRPEIIVHHPAALTVLGR